MVKILLPNAIFLSGQPVSMSIARRLVKIGAVKVNGEVVTNVMTRVSPGDEITVGRRNPRTYKVLISQRRIW